MYIHWIKASSVQCVLKDLQSKVFHGESYYDAHRREASPVQCVV